MGMKAFDRIMELSADAATFDDPHYEVYRIGVQWVTVGMCSVGLGLLGDSLHMELVGNAIASGGAAVLWLGGGVVASEMPNLTDH